jgi:hypothetical protein
VRFLSTAVLGVMTDRILHCCALYICHQGVQGYNMLPVCDNNHDYLQSCVSIVLHT